MLGRRHKVAVASLLLCKLHCISLTLFIVLAIGAMKKVYSVDGSLPPLAGQGGEQVPSLSHLYWNFPPGGSREWPSSALAVDQHGQT